MLFVILVKLTKEAILDKENYLKEMKQSLKEKKDMKHIFLQKETAKYSKQTTYNNKHYNNTNEEPINKSYKNIKNKSPVVCNFANSNLNYNSNNINAVNSSNINKNFTKSKQTSIENLFIKQDSDKKDNNKALLSNPKQKRNWENNSLEHQSSYNQNSGINNFNTNSNITNTLNTNNTFDNNYYSNKLTNQESSRSYYEYDKHSKNIMASTKDVSTDKESALGGQFLYTGRRFQESIDSNLSDTKKQVRGHSLSVKQTKLLFMDKDNIYNRNRKKFYMNLQAKYGKSNENNMIFNSNNSNKTKSKLSSQNYNTNSSNNNNNLENTNYMNFQENKEAKYSASVRKYNNISNRLNNNNINSLNNKENFMGKKNNSIQNLTKINNNSKKNMFDLNKIKEKTTLKLMKKIEVNNNINAINKINLEKRKAEALLSKQDNLENVNSKYTKSNDNNNNDEFSNKEDSNDFESQTNMNIDSHVKNIKNEDSLLNTSINKKNNFTILKNNDIRIKDTKQASSNFISENNNLEIDISNAKSNNNKEFINSLLNENEKCEVKQIKTSIKTSLKNVRKENLKCSVNNNIVRPGNISSCTPQYKKNIVTQIKNRNSVNPNVISNNDSTSMYSNSNNKSSAAKSFLSRLDDNSKRNKASSG